MGLNYYDNMKDPPLSDLLIQANIKVENQLMVFSGSRWQYFPDTGKIIVAYIVFYQGEKIYHVTHVPGPVSQSSAETGYNATYTSGITLAHLRMLIHELLSKDPDIFPEEDPLIIFDSKYAFCMTNNGKDIKHTRHIFRKVYFLKKGEKLKMHKIDWYEGGLQLADIATDNVGYNYLNPIMKCIMVRLDKW